MQEDVEVLRILEAFTALPIPTGQIRLRDFVKPLFELRKISIEILLIYHKDVTRAE